MNNIQQFLEEEITDFGIDFGHARNCDVQPPNDGEQLCYCGYEQLEEWVKNHDTRLINFILGEVKREVEKKLQSNEFWKQTFPQEYVEGYRIATDDISTIVNNLRVK